MKKSFWHQLKKPIIGLSPMDGVTDQSFRYIQKKYGHPDVVYTEFVNVAGLHFGAIKPLRAFIFDKTQEPIVAQIYGKTPEYFYQASLILCELGFDGVDINMGCPAKNVRQSGSGAALIKTPKLAQEIVKATKQGVADYLDGKRMKDCKEINNKIKKEILKLNEGKTNKKKEIIPVSIKTRTGYDTPITEEWISTLLETEPDLIALHGRTLKQQYSGKADWQEISKAVELCHQNNTLILGNGDIKEYGDIKKRVEETKVDGVLIGRASFGNPSIFNPELKTNIFEIALEHARVFEQTYPDDKFLPMRKHLSWYTKGFSKAKEVRAKLVKTNSADEVEAIFKKYELI